MNPDRKRHFNDPSETAHPHTEFVIQHPVNVINFLSSLGMTNVLVDSSSNGTKEELGYLSLGKFVEKVFEEAGKSFPTRTLEHAPGDPRFILTDKGLVIDSYKVPTNLHYPIFDTSRGRLALHKICFQADGYHLEFLPAPNFDVTDTD